MLNTHLKDGVSVKVTQIRSGDRQFEGHGEPRKPNDRESIEDCWPEDCDFKFLGSFFAAYNFWKRR